MKGCRPGDIVLAPFRLGNTTYPRPLVILSITEEGDVQVCPVTSRRPSDSPAPECSIHDFREGGLDLFEVSYILTHKQGTITEKSIRHKKGVLEPDYFRAILDSVRSF